MSKIIYGVLIFYFSFAKVYSQDVIDNEEKYKLLALHTLFSEGLNTNKTIVNKDNFITFFSNTKLNITKIEDENFDGISFYHVEEAPISADVKVENSLPIIWDLNSCDGYIIAIIEDNNYVYKLKGFVRNEFYNFYRSLKSYKFPHTKNKKVFLKNYKVAGLDFKCLFASLKLKLSEDDLEDYPCVSDTCLRFFKTHNF